MKDLFSISLVTMLTIAAAACDEGKNSSEYTRNPNKKGANDDNKEKEGGKTNDNKPSENDGSKGNRTTPTSEGQEIYEGKIFGGTKIDLSKGSDLGHNAKSSGTTESNEVTVREVSKEVGLSGVTNAGNGHGTANGFVDVNGDGFADVILIGAA